jgi:hypothetical protein
MNLSIDIYLVSPKKFHLEMPLYLEIDLRAEGMARKIHDLISFYGKIDAFCVWCGKDSIFKTNHYCTSNFEQWNKYVSDINSVSYECFRNTDHEYRSYYKRAGYIYMKIGQFPSVADFQIPLAQKYRKILGESQYKEFTKGIGLAAHGVGIGSFVYLRRIFENLIEEAHIKAKEEKHFTEENYISSRMDEKISLLKDYLPSFLVENKKIYSILSTGIHELSEETCLKYFTPVKIGVEQILDEKIEKAEKVQLLPNSRNPYSCVGISDDKTRRPGHPGELGNSISFGAKNNDPLEELVFTGLCKRLF